MLFRSLRIHQIFGANTEVGKTIFSTALCRTSLALGEKVSYLKPVGTGDLDEGDDRHVARYANSSTAQLSNNTCLFRFQEPVSPHLAVERDSASGNHAQIPTDEEFVQAIHSFSSSCVDTDAIRQALYIETAGGVHSPTLSGTSQAEAYRPLLLPTILIASPHLGGISTTISAYESLLLRGYKVDAVLCMKEDYYSNWSYLRKYFTEQRQINFTSIRQPPKQVADIQQDRSNMSEYYKQLASQDGDLSQVVKHLEQTHQDRLQDLATSAERTLKHVWWPFVQHADITHPNQVQVIDSAKGDHFSVFSSAKDTQTNLLTPTFDSSASWWTQCLGHAHSELVLAMAHAAGRYGHVIFPTSTHKPALDLTEKLLATVGNGWASRVFFSDDGSTATEVGIKMALHAYAKANNVKEEEKPFLGILGLKGSYHGDTIGAMDASEPSVYSKSVEWYRGRGYWFDPPAVLIQDGKAVVKGELAQETSFDDLAQLYDVENRLESTLATAYRQRILETLERITQGPKAIKFGALVMEPVVMGAAGMIFVDPLFQRVLVDTVRSSATTPFLSFATSSSDATWRNLPVLFDEVFTGLHRIGPISSSHLLGCSPDIACFAKILTGGMLPMSVTLASESIFTSYLGERKTDALLHGHSYTAQPIGCAVANKTLDMLGTMDWAEAKENWSAAADGPWSMWDKDVVLLLSKEENVKGVMALGTVLSVQVAGSSTGYLSTSAADLLKRVDLKLRKDSPEDLMAIHGRTLGDVLYFMCSLNSPAPLLRKLEQALLSTLAS